MSEKKDRNILSEDSRFNDALSWFAALSVTIASWVSLAA